MTSSVIKPMPNVLDKIQQSLQTPVNRIFDSTAGQMMDALNASADEKTAKPEKKPEKPQESESNRGEALDFALDEAGNDAQAKEEKVTLKLPDFNNEVIDEFNNKLAKLKQHFFTELNHAFDKSLQRQSRKLRDNSSDELQLVSHDELDLQIILTHIESSLLQSHRKPLTLATLRFEHIVKHELNLAQLPLGPVALGHAFFAAVNQLELAAEDKKNVLLALLLNLRQQYGELLAQANKLMIANNILPELTEEDTASREKEEQNRREAQEKRKQLLGVDADSDDEQVVSGEIARFIQQLDIPEEAGHHVIKSKQGAPQISTEELAAKVDLIRSAPVTSEDGVYRKLESNESLAEQLGEKAQLEEYGLNAQSSNTISLMSMVFENLLGNEHVPEEIKALLSQLQAPLLKAAVQDEMFFGDAENPAQKLFNGIAEASVSWSPEKNPEHDHLYKKMSYIVDKVSNDFDDDYLIFDEAIEDFFTYKESEEEKSTQVESRIVDRETAQARLKTARETAASHIRKKFGSLDLPPPIREFIDTTWQQVLFFIYNKEHDKKSVPWQDAIEIENSLLANLRSGEEEDIEVFMIVLEEKLHDSGIAEAEVEQQKASVEKALKAGHSGIEAAIFDEEDEEADADANRKAEEDELLKDIRIGSWIKKLDSDPPVKVKVAAHIKFNDTWVMVLRNGMKEGTYSRQQLLEMIRNKQLEVVESALAFDSALESVISDIR